MTTPLDTKTLQEIYQFMGEMRSERDHRDELLELQAMRLKKMEDEIQKTNDKVDGLISKIGRWESKLGTFMFIASCLWAALVAFKSQILDFIKG